MTLWHALVMGIVEGVTEFLPVSSTGHLVIAQHLLGIASSEFVKSFELVIQVGAIAAVLTVYHARLREMWDIKWKIALAFLPTAVVGAFLYKWIVGNFLTSPMVVVVALALGGVALLVAEWWMGRREVMQGNASALTEVVSPVPVTLSFPQAFGIGAIQALSIIPGVSRAAASIVGGLSLGLSRKAAVDFSFFLAVPTIVAAVGYDLFQTLRETPGVFEGTFPVLAVGFVVSFLVAWAVIKVFLRWIQSHSLAVFGWYRIFAAAVFWYFLV